MNDYFRDKITGHRGVIVTDKFDNRVICKDCDIVTKGNSEKNAKHNFVREHNKKK